MSLFEDEPEVQRIGKDELNLVELPFTSLTTKPGALAVIENEWETRHPKSGRVVKAKWRVAGDPERGLPNATDERVYLALMELTREQGMPQTVTFTRYDLLKRLGWDLGHRSYKQLEESLDRLAHVTISGKNAYWDKKAQAFVNDSFHILDNVKHISNDPGEGETTESFFKWNDTIYANLEAGYIRSIDLGFAYSLELPLSLRLYRYLHKKSHDGKRFFEIELSRLCEIHLGMTGCKYASQFKQRLKNAHDELISRGFLHAVEYEPMRSKEGGEKVRYVFRGEQAAEEPAEAPTVAPETAQTLPQTPERAAALKAVYDGLPKDEQARLLEEAKQGVADIFWPRLTDPGSPVSFALWDIVDREYNNE